MLTLQSATIRADGRILRLTYKSSGEPPDYGMPDRALAAGLPTLSTGAPLEYIASTSQLGEYPPINGPGIEPTGTLGITGYLPVGTYYISGVIKDGSGNVVGRTQPQALTITSLGQWINVGNVAGRCYPYGYTAEIYLSQPNGGLSTLGLYTTFTYSSTYPATQTTGQTVGSGIQIYSATWQNSGQAPPAYTGIYWTADYLITSDASVVTLGTTGITVSAPAGVLIDDAGNTSAPLSSVAVTNQSLVDSSGFTDPSLSSGATVAIYVAGESGSDSGDGTIARPYATWDKALLYFANKYKNAQVWGAIRCLRGATIQCDSPPGLNTSGISRTEPFTIESYWTGSGPDPGTRPIIQCNNTSQPIGPVAVSNILIRGLNFQSNEGISSQADAINSDNPVSTFTVDDCIMQGFMIGICIEAETNSNTNSAPGVGDFARDITVLRSMCLDNHGVVNNHGQGIFTDVYKDVLISQSVFDRNGYTDTGFTQSTIFNHNIYCQGGADPITMWGTYNGRAAADGGELRSGARVGYCVYDANAIDGFVSGIGGGFYKCFCQKSHDVNGYSDGNGLDLNQSSSIIHGEEVDSCILVNKLEGTSDKDPQAIQFTSLAPSSERYSAIRNNIVFNSGEGLSFGSASSAVPTKLTVSNNLFDCGSAFTYVENFTAISSWAWDGSDYNYFAGTKTTQYGNATKPLFGASNSWVSLTGGTEAHSTAVTPTYPNSSADLGTYGQTLGVGLSSESDYRNYLRSRPARTWDSTFEMIPVYDYFVEQYQPSL